LDNLKSIDELHEKATNLTADISMFLELANSFLTYEKGAKEYRELAKKRYLELEQLWKEQETARN
jgi:hypothetical protein